MAFQLVEALVVAMAPSIVIQSQDPLFVNRVWVLQQHVCCDVSDFDCKH